MIGRPPKLPKLGRPKFKDVGQQRFADALIEWIESRDPAVGRGDRMEALLTRREAVEIGLLRTSAQGFRLVPAAPDLSGVGPPVMTVPPAIEEFEAGAAVQNIILSWPNQFLVYRNHAFVEVWRAEVNDLGEAVKVGQARGTMYSDPVGPGAGRYYWVRSISTSDVPGPFNAVAGTYAETGVDTAYLLVQLEGEIREDQLFASLAGRINLIDGPASLAGSVNKRLDDKAAVLQAEIDTINSVLSDIQALPEFDENEDWDEGDIVRFEGALFRALQNMTDPSPDPTDTDFWEKIGDYASLGDAVAAHAAILSDHETRIESTEDGLAAEVSRTNSLQAAVEDSETGLATKASSTDLSTAVADIYGAAVSAFTQIDARFDSTDTAINARATITQLNTAVAEAESGAIAEATQQVWTALGEEDAAGVSTRATAWNGVSAQWTVQTQVGDLVAGIGLLNDGDETRFYVRADRFAVYDTDVDEDTDKGVPFIVKDGQVYIRIAAIENATITVAKLQEAFVDALVAAQGKFQFAQIDRGDIFELTIGEMIVSDNYSPGSSGFILSKDGFFEIGAANTANIDYAHLGGTKPPADADNTALAGDITVMNPGLEEGVKSWGLSIDMTIVNDPANAYSGDWVMKFIGAGTSRVAENFRRNATVPGERWIGSCMIRRESGNGSARVSLTFRDAAGNTLARIDGNVISNDGNWHQSRVVATAPANAVSVQIAWRILNSPTGVHYWDDFKLDRAPLDSDSPKLNDWTRPTSTLIDGNKIFTGDAYVDTLQIKGNAVTVPDSSFTAGDIAIDNTGYVTIQSVSHVVSGAGAPWPVKVTVSAVILHNGGDPTASLLGELRRGTTRIWPVPGTGSVVAGVSPVGAQTLSLTFEDSPGSGTHNYNFRLRTTGSAPSSDERAVARGRAMTAIGVKR